MRLHASEADLQEAVCQLLEHYERMGRLAFFAVCNGGTRFPREVVKLKRQGLRPGVPDLVVLFGDARAHFWELKASNVSPILKGDQFKWQKRLLILGYQHRVIRSVEEADKAIKIETYGPLA